MRNIKTIILASASPRRKEILEKTGLKFRVDKSEYEEKIDPGLKPHELARFLSRKKARYVARRHRNALVIAADTIVVLRGRLFVKPEGDFFNVMGLPLNALTESLKKFGIKVLS